MIRKKGERDEEDVITEQEILVCSGQVREGELN
jgi:hypothetical protein